MGKVILNIACSLDGFIAGENDNIDFLNSVAKEGEDYGYSEFYSGVGTVILGRKTFEKVLTLTGGVNPHSEKAVWVLSRTSASPVAEVNYYNGDVSGLIKEIIRGSDKDVYCDGGAEVVLLLMNLNLIDEMIISIIPTILGKGTKLFKDGISPVNLKLNKSESFSTGLVQLRYSLI
ncbi:MAG: dihydrofolate reductase [Bacteroidetes bacterium]|nr:dihydrofolate reductase [Bacteroidota bacterium]